DGRRSAEAEWAALGQDQPLAGVESLLIDVGSPLHHDILRQLRRTQTVEDAKILYRVCVAGEHHRERSHPRARRRIFRQKWRLWMGFVEPLDDRKRLRDDAVV